MDLRKKSKRITDQAGFTFIEVIFAILLLAGSLTILLGLQSSIVAATIHEKYQLRGMAAAREILAAIETSPEIIANREDKDLSIPDLFREISQSSEDTFSDDNDQYRDLLADLSVVEHSYPLMSFGSTTDQFSSLSVKEILLSVHWGPHNHERISVKFYIPFQPPEDSEDEEEEDF